MKYLRILLSAVFTLLLVSCNDDAARMAETQRTQKMNDSILKVISRNWHFDVSAPGDKVREKLNGWNEWQQFNNELQQKPTGSIEAYRRKTEILVNKANQLRNNIPAFFDRPQVRSRLGVLIVKTKMLHTFLDIETIPDKKVVSLIKEVTQELDATQQQFNEIITFSEIPKEEGEEEMLRALDTTRLADPDAVAPIEYEEGRPLPQNNSTSPGHGAGYINRKS